MVLFCFKEKREVYALTTTDATLNNIFVLTKFVHNQSTTANKMLLLINNTYNPKSTTQGTRKRESVINMIKTISLDKT